MTDHARDDRAREIDTAALRALHEKAPAGEWWVDRRANLLWTRDHKGPYTIAESRGWGHYTGRGHGALGLPDEAAIAIEHATLEFAAQAHNSLPALLDEIDRLRAENERLRENHEIVARIWRQLGSPTYEQLAGRSIYDLIDELKAKAEPPRHRSKIVSRDIPIRPLEDEK